LIPCHSVPRSMRTSLNAFAFLTRPLRVAADAEPVGKVRLPDERTEKERTGRRRYAGMLNRIDEVDRFEVSSAAQYFGPTRLKTRLLD